MAKRIVQIANELNIATTTVVDFLQKKGFEVDPTPQTKLSDDMERSLMQEFSSSQAIKVEADKITLGSSRPEKKETPSLNTLRPSAPKLTGLTVTGKIDLSPATKPIVTEKPKPVEQSSKPAEIKPTVIEPKPVVKEEPKAEEPKVIQAQEKVAEKPAPVEIKAPEKVIEKVVEKAPENAAENAPESHFLETKRVELTGPKILGKINLPVQRPPVKKEVPAAKDDKKKRKRKTIVKNIEGNNNPNRGNSPSPNTGVGSNPNQTQNPGGNTPRPGGYQGSGGNTPRPGGYQGSGGNQGSGGYQGSGGGYQGNRGNNSGARPPFNKNAPRTGNDEVKEVTSKEVQDKINATMARLSGGGKNKRQKIRRDNRDRIREKQEGLDDSQDRLIEVTEFVSVSELANMMDIPPTQIIMTCMNMGVIVSINQRLDAEIIELLASEFDYEVKFISAEEENEEEEIVVDAEEDLNPRAPIVTVMGHVDHGKTSLLDFIRKTKVTEGEAGGITQHIGAYEVKVGPDSKKVAFLDTPGHEAFTAMRARGAKVTDIAVIIIAADDNVMPQTKEAISHAQAAGVPMIFAINKIDKQGANTDKIREELSQMNILVEEWGGKYQCQEISAKKGVGIDDLLVKILLEAEMLELKANPNRQALGTVIEASLEKGKGYVTSILVQNGTLHLGDSIVAGAHSGKVKAMFNESGKKIKKAGPSCPVAILGLDGAPQAGEKIKVVDNDQEARQIASKRAQIQREQQQRASKRVSLDDIGRRLALGTFKELKLIVKGDVDGSIEALADSLIKQSVDTVQVNVIHKAVGQIIESDVLLASASDAIIIGFQVRPSVTARKLAESEGVEIKTYSIIYDAIGEIKAAIEGMLEPTEEEKILGTIQVREVFKISKVGTIAGCFVQDGKIARDSFVRVVRQGIVVYPSNEKINARLSSLKRFKDDVKEVLKGYECGLSIDGFNDIRQDDEIETYEIIQVKQKLK